MGDSRRFDPRPANSVLGDCAHFDDYVSLWLDSTLPDHHSQKWTISGIDRLRENHTNASSQLIRENGHYLPANSFHIRKQHLTSEEGPLTVGMNTEGAVRNPMQDPMQMGDALKGQMTNMLPMIVIGGWVSYTFSGFLTARVPFPLTLRFKQLMQRGIDLASLDASWISSMSRYFIGAFGMRGVYELVLGEDNQADQARAMQQQMPGGPGGQIQDEQKAFKAEWEAMKIVEYRNSLENVEKAILET